MNSLLLLVLIDEALDAAFSVDQLVLAREERMAIRANFDLDVGLGGAGLDDITASAAHGRLNVLRMNSLFHRGLGISDGYGRVNDPASQLLEQICYRYIMI